MSELSPENLALLRRFGGERDRYGLGIVAIDCSEENLEALLNAAREEGRTSLPVEDGSFRSAQSQMQPEHASDKAATSAGEPSAHGSGA